MIAPVSIIIPIRSEDQAVLEELLVGLKRQAVLPQEVIFVEADPKDEVVRAKGFIKTWWPSNGWEGGDCRVLPNPGVFPGAGRNVGINAAKGEWIAFLDAGIIPQSNWLSSLLAYAREHKVKAVFGVGRFSGHGAVGRAVCALSYGEGAISPRGILPASLFHREVFEKVGLFLPHLKMHEDTQWKDRFSEKPPVNGNALVEYNHFPKSVAGAVKKWFESGLYAVRAGVKGRQQALYLLGLSGLLASTLFFDINAVLLVLVVTVFVIRGCLIPMTRSSSWHWWKGEPLSLVAALPLSLAMDVAKGAGFLFGYLDKAIGERFSKTDRTNMQSLTGIL